MCAGRRRRGASTAKTDRCPDRSSSSDDIRINIARHRECASSTRRPPLSRSPRGRPASGSLGGIQSIPRTYPNADPGSLDGSLVRSTHTSMSAIYSDEMVCEANRTSGNRQLAAGRDSGIVCEGTFATANSPVRSSHGIGYAHLDTEVRAKCSDSRTAGPNSRSQ